MGSYVSTSRRFYSNAEEDVPSSPGVWQSLVDTITGRGSSASSAAISGEVRFSNVVGEEALFTEPASPAPVGRLRFTLPSEQATASPQSKMTITQEMHEDDSKQRAQFVSTQQFVWEDSEGGFQSPPLGGEPLARQPTAQYNSRLDRARAANAVAGRTKAAAVAAASGASRARQSSGPAAAALSAVSALSANVSALSARTTGAVLTSPPLRNISNSNATTTPRRTTGKIGNAGRASRENDSSPDCWGDVSTPMAVKTPYVKTPTRIRFFELV